MFFGKRWRRAKVHQHPVYREFVSAAQKWPKRVAVRSEGTKVRYQELYDQVQSVVAHLSAIEPAGPIAICHLKDRFLPALLFGVLGAGRAYLYLDPNDSVEQHLAVLRISGCAAIVVDSSLNKGFGSVLNDVCLISTESCQIRAIGELNLPPDQSGGICCLIQTSGSTGAPKLVEVRSEAVLNNASQFKKTMQLGIKDKVGWLASPKVAASNSALYGALLNGAALCPFRLMSGSLGTMTRWMKSERVTLLHMTPSLFRAMARYSDRTSFTRIRGVKLGGESVYPMDLALFRASFPSSCRLVNGLGISEAGGNICHCDLTQYNADASGLLPVGKVLPGYELALIDDQGQPVDTGEEGEIVLRSKLITHSYLGDRGASSRFHQLTGGRTEFRTGDWGQLDATKTLFFIGRKDRVVKIRGFRVDLNVIEAELISISGVNTAFVTTEGSVEQPGLIAFVEAIDSSVRVLECLRALLPAQMIPSCLEVIREMPRTEGGKVDRQALLTGRGERRRADFVAPQTQTEKALAELIQEQLPEAEIGVSSDFFKLGGDSLKGLELIARIAQRLNWNISPAWLIKHPTIERMIEGISSPSNQLVEEVTSQFLVEVICLRDGDESKPWLVFPGGFAGADELLVFTHVFSEINEGPAVYGVRMSFGAYWEALPASFEAMQREVEDALVAFFAGRPFNLLGECVSCSLALSVAASLKIPRVFLLAPTTGVGRIDDRSPGHESIDPIKRLYCLLRAAKPDLYFGKVHLISCAEEQSGVSDYMYWWSGALKSANVTSSFSPGHHESYIREHRKELLALLTELSGGESRS